MTARGVPIRLAEHPLTWIGKLGEGASSEVWEVALAGEHFALKIATFAARETLASEAEKLLLCSSLRLPDVLDVGLLPAAMPPPAGSQVAPGSPFLLLSLARGTELGRLLPSCDREHLARRVLRDVGQALADLHAAGFSHGDIKPQNIVAEVDDPNGHCTLLDLGLSDALSQGVPRGATPRYLPPELWQRSASSDGRTRDLWALGVTLLELLVPDSSPAANTHSPKTEDTSKAEGSSRAKDPGAAEETESAAPSSTSFGALTASGVRSWIARAPAALQPVLAALLREQPRARPQADWASRQSGLSEAAGTARARRKVWQSYLAGYTRQLLRVAHGYRYKITVTGQAGQWLQSCCEQLTRIAQLRGVPRTESVEILAELEQSGQRRWLLDLIGVESVDFPALPQQSDSALLAQLLALADAQPPESFTYAALVLHQTHAEDALPTAIADFALLLAAEAPREKLLLAVEQLVFRGEATRAMTLTLARTLKRRHAMARALAVLDALTDPEANLERAGVLVRLGELKDPAAWLEAALADTAATEPQRADARALIARVALQSGDATKADALLQGAMPTLRVLEAQASLALTRGQLAEAQVMLERALSHPHNAEDRARIEALFANLEQQRGNSAHALQRFRKAVEHAARAGALLEEATYLIGIASTATNLGWLAEAMGAAERSALLFEYLQRPEAAARAWLSKATALAAAGANAEAEEAAEQSRRLAKLGHDQRCQAFAHLVLTDVTPPARAADHLQRAASLLDSTRKEDGLQLAVRRLRLGTLDDAANFDDQVGRDLPADLRLEWWGARARQTLLSVSLERPEPLLEALCALLHSDANVFVQGPAFAYGAQLAARVGDGERTRLLASAAAAALRQMSQGLPPERRLVLASLDWAKQVSPPAHSQVSDDQVADIETLIHSLSERSHLRSLLDRSLDALVRWTAVERGLLLLTAPGGRLQARAARNLARKDLTGDQLHLSMSLAQRALQSRECVVAMDATGELPSVHASVHALKLRSVLAVPLMARGEVLGVAYLDDRMRSGAFGKRELDWVRLVGTLIAIAIADTRDQLLLRRAARKARKAEERVTQLLAQRETALIVATAELSRSRARRTRFDYDQIVGESPAVQALLQLVDRVVPSDIPVLVLGPSGSGKELVARAIHFNGPRAQAPFVTENCSAIPETLLESILFGHVKGAFTGAARHHAGLFEIAHGGTLLLDEIADMSLGMQSKLLRVLENGEIRRVGSERTQRVDVRVIGATHKDLEALVRAKLFREDLYYRLNVITLRVPALAERSEDIPVLVRHFLTKCAPNRAVALGAHVLQALCAHAWPGNVRQLENEIRRALVLADDEIRLEHLTSAWTEHAPTPAPSGLNMRQRLDALESQLVRGALEQTQGNQTKAALLLGVSRFGLQKMIRRLAITPGDSSHSRTD